MSVRSAARSDETPQSSPRSVKANKIPDARRKEGKMIGVSHLGQEFTGQSIASGMSSNEIVYQEATGTSIASSRRTGEAYTKIRGITPFDHSTSPNQGDVTDRSSCESRDRGPTFTSTVDGRSSGTKTRGPFANKVQSIPSPAYNPPTPRRIHSADYGTWSSDLYDAGRSPAAQDWHDGALQGAANRAGGLRHGGGDEFTKAVHRGITEAFQDDIFRRMLRTELRNALLGDTAVAGDPAVEQGTLTRRAPPVKEAAEQPRDEKFTSASEDAKRYEPHVVTPQPGNAEPQHIPRPDMEYESVEREQEQGGTQPSRFGIQDAMTGDQGDLPEFKKTVTASYLMGVEDFFGESDDPWYAKVILALRRRIASAEEPQRSGCLFALLCTKGFETFCLFVIVLHAVFMVLSLDKSLESLTDSGSESEAVGDLFWVEYVFLGWYIFELSLRFIVHKQYFFLNEHAGWNIFDLFVVSFTVADVLFQATGDESGVDLGYLRLMRMWKIARVLRMFRAVKFFTQLGLLLKCFTTSFVSLMWSAVCIAFLLFLFAVIFLQGFVSHLSSHALGEEEMEPIRAYFGSVTRAMGSLFEAISGGNDWALFYDLVKPLGSFYSNIFLFFILFMMIATMNIISSIFLERTMRAAEPSADDKLQDREEKNKKDARDLLKLCRELDVDQDGDGLLSLKEMTRCMQDPSIRKYFEARGVHFEDVRLMYQMLAESAHDAGRKGITPERFVKVCLRLNDPCSGLDIHTLAYEVKVLHNEHKRLAKHCHDQFAIHHETLHSLHGHIEHHFSTAYLL